MVFEKVENFSWVQTFYADPEIVNNSGEIALTSVDLYFKTKPSRTNNTSGKNAPGVVVRICEVVNNEPDLNKVFLSAKSYRSYDNVYSFSDGSTATTFGFNVPVKLQTGRFYGIVVSFEDPGYELWTNKSGDRLIGSNFASPGSNLVRDGLLFRYTNAGQYRALSDSDLKFRLNVARYVSNNATEAFVNRDYEFLTCNTISGRFFGGEWVYQTVANATGNVAVVANTRYVTGTGTSFDTEVVAGDKIVIASNSTHDDLLDVRNVVNSTYIETTNRITTSNNSTTFQVPPVGRVHYFRRNKSKMYLIDSNANTTLKFTANTNPINGVDSKQTALIQSIDAKSIDSLSIKSSINIPPSGVVNATFTVAKDVGGSYDFSFNDKIVYDITNNSFSQERVIPYDGYILSRSVEVSTANLHSNVDVLIDRKSFVSNVSIGVNLSNAALFQAPQIQFGTIDVFTGENNISNTYTTTDANNVVIDTEVGSDNGSAISKFYGQKISFANNRFAEDVRVYMTAYRPSGTDIKVYARLHNSTDPEAFDDKAWTPLTYKTGSGNFSSSEDRNDLIEYELGLSLFSETANALPGSFTTQSGNNVAVAQGVDPTTYLATNDVVKIYNPLIPQDYIVGYVSAANSTTFTLGDNISNNNVVGSGLKVDRLKYYNIGFNNITNDNVARYYSSTLVEYDKFDTMQVKIVLLADTTYIVPEVDQIQVIGVSA